MVRKKKENKPGVGAPGKKDVLVKIKRTPKNKKKTSDDGVEDANQTDLILQIALNDCTFFHDQYDEPHAYIDMGGYFEIQPISSRFFKRWLAGQVWHIHGQVMNNDVFRNVKNILEGQSLFAGKKIELHNRVAWGNDSIFYDLSNENWEVVKITEKGWTIENGIIKFRRYTHQTPQERPTPTKKGDVTLVLKYLNLKNDDDKLLSLVLLISSFIPDIPHPYPDLYGDKGSAKTTFFKIFKKLIDPSLLETLTLPTNQNELLQQISHHWCAYYDNVSYIKDWQSDCLCRAVTGDGLSKRALYTNDEDVIYNYKRCIGLNGINISAEKPDLLDRGVLIELERIPKNERKADKTFFQEFEKDRPVILGGIFNVLSKAMKIKNKLEFKELPRMADFAEWGEAISQALGYEKEVFLVAYFQNIGSQNIEALETHIIGLPILRLMEHTNQWIGTPTELLDEITKLAGELRINTETRSWPKHPNTLWKRINEIKSNLNEENIIFTRDRKGGKNSRRLFKFTKNIVTIVTSSPSSVFGDDGVTTGKDGDDNIGDDGDDKKVVSSHISSPQKQDSDEVSYNIGDDGDDTTKTFNNREEREERYPNGISSHPRQKADEEKQKSREEKEDITIPKVKEYRIPLKDKENKELEKIDDDIRNIIEMLCKFRKTAPFSEVLSELYHKQPNYKTRINFSLLQDRINNLIKHGGIIMPSPQEYKIKK